MHEMKLCVKILQQPAGARDWPAWRYGAWQQQVRQGGSVHYTKTFGTQVFDGTLVQSIQRRRCELWTRFYPMRTLTAINRDGRLLFLRAN